MRPTDAPTPAELENAVLATAPYTTTLFYVDDRSCVHAVERGWEPTRGVAYLVYVVKLNKRYDVKECTVDFDTGMRFANVVKESTFRDVSSACEYLSRVFEDFVE